MKAFNLNWNIRVGNWLCSSGCRHEPSYFYFMWRGGDKKCEKYKKKKETSPCSSKLFLEGGGLKQNLGEGSGLKSKIGSATLNYFKLHYPFPFKETFCERTSVVS